MTQQPKGKCICGHSWELHRHTHSGKLITGAFCSGQGCRCKEYTEFTRGVKRPGANGCQHPESLACRKVK